MRILETCCSGDSVDWNNLTISRILLNIKLDDERSAPSIQFNSIGLNCSLLSNLIISLLRNSLIRLCFGKMELLSFSFSMILNNLAKSSANIFGIPSSSIENENLVGFLFLNLAMDVVIGPLLAS